MNLFSCPVLPAFATPAVDRPPAPGDPPARAKAPRSLAITVMVAALGWVPLVKAQPAQFSRTPPHIGYAYPAGGQVGTTVTMSVGGQNLNGTNAVYVSVPGISGHVVGYDRPLTQKEINDLREQIQALTEKRAAALGLDRPERKKDAAGASAADQRQSRTAAKTQPQRASGTGRGEAGEPGSTSPATGKPVSGVAGLGEAGRPGATPPTTTSPKPTWTSEDQWKLAELREKMATRGNRQANPALAETVSIELAIPAGVQPGTCELRLATPAGISNPAFLEIGQLPEFVKPVVTATMNVAPRPNRPNPGGGPARARGGSGHERVAVTIPITINGQILPGAVDRYQFAAKKGQHITVAVSARSLLPYLADAVPGWFQATLGLYDPQGREVAYSDSFRFSPDPVVSYAIPQDGTYSIEIKDSIYRGREDFVYRIAIGELPFVTSIFPLGGRNPDPATFALSGWNLPQEALTVDTKDKAPGTFLLAVRQRGQLSNVVRFALDTEPDCREVEPNDTPSQAQPLNLPIVVDGRIQAVGDADAFRFQGHAGQDIVAEVFARRLGSPLDSALRLSDSAGRPLAFNDDHEDKGAGLMTHHADSRISLKLPADGTYVLTLTDAQHHGGPEYGYRLRVGPPQPDFELRVAPSALNVHPGANTPVTVYALRRDGFDGDITLALDNAPFGFALTGAVIPAGQDKVQVTLTAPPLGANSLVGLTLVGSAAIGGKDVTRVAVPAEDMMQAFAYHHLVPVTDFLVDVGGRPVGRSTLAVRGTVKITSGGTARIVITANLPRGLSGAAAELNSPPDGITVKSASASGNRLEIVVACDAAKAKPGLRGNLVFDLFGVRTNPNAKAKQQRVQRIPFGCAPAVPFEVVAPVVAEK